MTADPIRERAVSDDAISLAVQEWRMDRAQGRSLETSMRRAIEVALRESHQKQPEPDPDLVEAISRYRENRVGRSTLAKSLANVSLGELMDALAALRSRTKANRPHQFTGNGPGITGADNCQICGRWYDEPETDVCKKRLPHTGLVKGTAPPEPEDEWTRKAREALHSRLADDANCDSLTYAQKAAVLDMLRAFGLRCHNEALEKAKDEWPALLAGGWVTVLEIRRRIDSLKVKEPA